MIRSRLMVRCASRLSLRGNDASADGARGIKNIRGRGGGGIKNKNRPERSHPRIQSLRSVRNEVSSYESGAKLEETAHFEKHCPRDKHLWFL